MAIKDGLKPPQRLEDWTDYSFHNEIHAPWLSKERRDKMRDIVDICIYGGNLMRVIDTIKDPFLKTFYKAVLTPINKYYSYKWNNKKFGRDPLLKGIRLLRKIKEDKTIKI